MEAKSESFNKWLRKEGFESIKKFSNEKSSVSAPSAGTSLGISEKLLTKAKEELNRMVLLPGNDEPDRGNLDDSTIEWRNGKPNYTLANLAYLKGKCMKHEKGSLEIIVQNAVKTWEMEASHKKNPNQWKTIIQDKYNVQTNNGRVINLDEAFERGNYNVLMDEIDPNVYDASKEDFASSHQLFHGTFNGSFPWEVLQVFSGPPEIVFSFRHWGEFTGTYQGNKGDGSIVEMNGFVAVTVTEDLKITDLKVYFKPENFIKRLKGEEFVDKITDKNESFWRWMEDSQKDQGCDIQQKTLNDNARKEIKKMQELEPELKEPDRGEIDDLNIEWNFARPDYSLVNLAYLMGKTARNGTESAVLFIENLIKRCEMEIKHKNRSQWKFISQDDFSIQLNGKDVTEKTLNLSRNFTSDNRKCPLSNPFPWEVTEIFSDKPKCTFAWRHWNENIELNGFAIVELRGDNKIKNIKVFYKSDEIITKFASENIDSCPFAKS